MLDLSSTGKVSLESYESFWKKFLEMYGELFNLKIDVSDQESVIAAKAVFNFISDG
jgi:hypothetical protein